MYSNEHTLQDLLKKAYHQMDMDHVVTEMEVRRAYHAMVGDLISRLTWSVKFANGTLTVRLASAALKQELNNRRTSLAEKLNEVVGSNVIQKIIIL